MLLALYFRLTFPLAAGTRESTAATATVVGLMMYSAMRSMSHPHTHTHKATTGDDNSFA